MDWTNRYYRALDQMFSYHNKEKRKKKNIQKLKKVQNLKQITFTFFEA